MVFLIIFINSLPVLGVPQCVFSVDSSAIQHESMNNSQATQSEHWDTQKKIQEWASGQYITSQPANAG